MFRGTSIVKSLSAVASRRTVVGLGSSHNLSKHFSCYALAPISLNKSTSTRRKFSTEPANAVHNPNAELEVGDRYDLREPVQYSDDFYESNRVLVERPDDDMIPILRVFQQLPNRKLYEELNFEKDIEVKSYSSIHSLQQGAYVNLEPTVIDKYFPEGFAGDMDKEFEFTSRTSWMVRPSVKFLGRLIETIDKKEAIEAGTPNERWRPTLIDKKPMKYQGLTDRAEWPKAKHDIRYYNTNIVQEVEQEGKKSTTEGVLPGRDMLGGDIESWMDKLHELSGKKGLPREILLMGERGCGKSSVLNQAVMYARSRGWICFFVPKGWDYVQSGDFIVPTVQKADGTVIYDNPQMTAQVLRGFYKAHAAQLQNIPIRDAAGVAEKYDKELKAFKKEWNRLIQFSGRGDLGFLKMRDLIEDDEGYQGELELDREMLASFDFPSFKIETLADLCLPGVAFRNFSGLAVLDLLAELKEVESVPVMIAVDNWNHWEVNTAFAYQSAPVNGKQLAIPSAINFLGRKREVSDKWKMKNGLCIAAVSLRHPQNNAHHVTYEGEESSVPLTIRVPRYDSTEFGAACAYYQSNWNLNTGVTTQEILAFRTMVGSLPSKMREDMGMFFVNVHIDRMRGGSIMSPYFYTGDEEDPYPNRHLLEMSGSDLGPGLEGDFEDRFDDDFEFDVDTQDIGSVGMDEELAFSKKKGGKKSSKKPAKRKNR